MLAIDHVVYAVRDLDEAGERWRRLFGLSSESGGRHPDWGTANRIVPLGDGYLELLSVVDRASAERSWLGKALMERTQGGDGWFAVCCRDDHLDFTAARLGLEISFGHRALPDGTELAWRSAGLDAPERDAHLPFFIEWDAPVERLPGRAAAVHRYPATGIARVDVSGGPARLEQWAGGAGDLPISCALGTPGIAAVWVGLEDGGMLEID